MIHRLAPGLLPTGAVGDGVYAIRDAVVNFFVVAGPAGLICIDAGWRSSAIRRGFGQLGLDMDQVSAVFLTHSHWDHARGAACFPRATVYASGARPGGPSNWRSLHDGQTVIAAGLHVRALATPGHTPDSMAFVVGERFLFTGDTLRLRRGKVVANYALASDPPAMRASIGKLSAIGRIECLLTSHWGLTRQVADAFGVQEAIA